MNSKIIKFGAGPNGEDIKKPVKNLGWLLKNWKRVDYIFILKTNNALPKPECELLGNIKESNNTIYFTEYASYQICLGFLDRPIFRGLPIAIKEINGQENYYVIGSPEYRLLIKSLSTLNQYFDANASKN